MIGMGTEKAAGVQAVTRALALLTLLGKAARPQSLTALAQGAGLSLSTTHRLLTTLQQDRYVRFDRGARGWAIGVQAYVTGSSFPSTRNLLEVAAPRLRRLTKETREMASLAVEENGEAHYLARIGSTGIVPEGAATSERTLLHCSAVGKAILAGIQEARVKAILVRRGMHRFTCTTLSSLPELAAELTLTRLRGYALDREERVLGARCVAAPIYDETGQALAAVSLLGASAYSEERRLDWLAGLVKSTASALTAEIGGRVPTPA